MRNEYYGSAKITYLDREAVWRALRSLVSRLAKDHPEVLKVAVFGSVARGEAVPGSDVDLLLVLASSDLPFTERFNKYRPERFPLGVEVFAYTQSEMERMLRESNAFLGRALKEAVTLFERQPAG